jgi:hypothetical protein
MSRSSSRNRVPVKQDALERAIQALGLTDTGISLMDGSVSYQLDEHTFRVRLLDNNRVEVSYPNLPDKIRTKLLQAIIEALDER